MALKIVHCADLHIGTSFSNLSSELASVRREELRMALKNIVNYCKNKAVDALIICGDLFDCPNPSLKDSEFVKSMFSFLAPTPVYIVCGNHDYMCNTSPYQKENYFSENVHIFPCFDHYFNLAEKNTVFWGKSYNKNLTEPTFSDIQFDNGKINILCLHGDVSDNSDYNTISRDFFFEHKCNYAAFGHIHNGEIFNLGETKCAYSGTPEGHSFNDDGHTGFIYAEITENETKLFPVTFSKRKYRNVTVAITYQSYEQIISQIKEILNENDLFRITLTGTFPEDVNISLLRETLSHNAFYIEIIDNTHSEYDFDAIEAEESLHGRFLRELRKISKSEEEFIRSGKAGLDALSGIIPSMEDEL